MRTQFNVVTKAALFNLDQSKVLVIHMDRNDDYGLPGGHLEPNEDIDTAMQRELFEECGVKAERLEKVGFFFHSSGKVVLAYKGLIISNDLTSQQDNLEGIPKWVSREEFENITIEPNYRDLVLKCWS